MASDLSRPNRFTPEKIAKLQQELRDHPIDNSFDDLCLDLDGDDPLVLQQMSSRLAYKILKRLGELPPDLELDSPPQFCD